MTIGQKITESRKGKGIKAADLAAKIGRSPAVMSDIENDRLKGGVDPAIVVKIANALDDNSILLHYLEENPVYQTIIPRIFPDLNNIRRDPAIIFSRLADEAEEARDAARILAQIFSNAEPRQSPNFDEVFKAKLEQIVDIQRCAEILFLQLIAAGVMTEEDRREIHNRQQNKCIDRGHHKPEHNGAEA
jgi:transcriptional regulator with XRE-family HTH domain